MKHTPAPAPPPAPTPARPGTSLVLEVPPAPPEVAAEHFSAKLAVETDPWDVHHDLVARRPGLVVVDTRSRAAFAIEHIPGAVNLPHRELDEAAAGRLPRDVLYVTYCTGPGCNASTRGAARLAGLGFRVKEMIGGLEHWRAEGFPTERG
jgi:rhodanese-related sulfurtransferase